MQQTCQAFQQYDLQQKWLISIAAGISVDTLQRYLPSAKQIVRVMPNTPALIGEGMSVYMPIRMSLQNLSSTPPHFSMRLDKAVG